jgi:hypothetical protein
MGETVRKTVCVWLWVFVIGALSAAAQRGAEGTSGGDQYAGTWVGTWDGAGSGGFELALERGKDGAYAGSVSVTGEPTYKATLKTVAFDGAKMTAKYDFTPNPEAEVVLDATFDGKTATGTWSAREKATGSEAAKGTWTVTRK